MRLSGHPFVARKRQAQFLSRDALGRLLEMVRRAFGVDFSTYKLNTVERRIARRMALQKIDKLDDYIRFLDSNSAELAVLYADLLIGVTNFFRDHEPFDALKTVVFPRLFEKRSAESPIRIWVPGCATGEEAYSIAISLVEYLDHVAGTRRVQIFATDIDEHALARARQAVYPPSIEVDVSSDRLQRFFVPHDKGYEVSRPIRDMVVFARHNVGKDPPFSRLDLVSCRNVLIYMTAPLQRKVLRVFHYALNPDGFLLLGASESVGEASDQFALLDRKLKIYLKKNVPSAAVFDFAAGTQAGVEAQAPSVPAVERRPPISLQQLADRKVLEKFAPPGLLIDENQNVIQFRGDTGPYLAPAPGIATLNVLKLVRPELMLELRTTLQRATDTGLPQVSRVLRLTNEPQERLVVLDIMLLADGGQKRCYLLVFRDQPVARPGSTEQPAEKVDAATQTHLQEMERELLVTKEYLQTTVQELEAANEELQSSNEELQSTNEELETSKEELQSTNEELATVNEELQNRMAQLNITNDDLKNVISGVTTAFVIVGMDLRIRVFSGQAERLLNLIAGDVGRPIAHLGASLDAPQIESLVSDAINTVRERNQRVRCSDGNWYTARMIPYRTSDHAIRGAVIEFLRAPAAHVLGEVTELHELATKVLATLPNVVIVLDDRLRIVWVNKAFTDELQTGPEVLGKLLDDVWAGRSTHPDLWNAIEETAKSQKPFDGIWVSHPFGRASDRPMMFSARSLQSEGERAALTLVVMENAGRSASP
ncbi:MAG TPA: CheR family methyltransferase [Kofleriaceae bacterium]|nr:CheR family methyltransferase [Kofleriaceae bacterium]